jgi:hypothetical protein
MVALGGGLLRHQLPISHLEPLFPAGIRGIRPVPDGSEPGVHPLDHLLRLVPELLGNRVETHRPPLAERLEPGRTVGLPEHPGFGSAGQST